MGQRVGKSITRRPSILYSLIRNMPIDGHLIVVSEWWLQACIYCRISWISIFIFRIVGINDDVWCGYGFMESLVGSSGVLGDRWEIGYVVLEW